MASAGDGASLHGCSSTYLSKFPEYRYFLQPNSSRASYFALSLWIPDGAIILWQKMDTLAQRVQSSAEMMDEEDESQWEQETWRQVRSLRYVTVLYMFHCWVFQFYDLAKEILD